MVVLWNISKTLFVARSVQFRSAPGGGKSRTTIKIYRKLNMDGGFLDTLFVLYEGLWINYDYGSD